VSEKTTKKSLKKLAKNEIVMIAITFLLLFPDFHGWFGGMEGRAFDLYMSLFSRSKVASAKVVVIDIDDQSYSGCFEGVSPLKPSKVVQLVNYALGRGAKVVAVDLITDSSDYRSARFNTNPGQTLIWAATAEAKDLDISFVDWLFGTTAQPMAPGQALGQKIEPDSPFHWAVPAYPRDEDLRIRRLPRYYPWSGHENRFLSTLPRRTAMEFSLLEHRSFDSDADEVMVTFQGEKLERMLAREILACPTSDQMAAGQFDNLFLNASIANQKPNHLEGRIVLIGGTFSAGRDFHETPLGTRPGVVINANAIQAELSGHFIHDPPKFWLFILDLSIGSVVAYIIWVAGVKKPRPLIWISIIAVVLLYVLAGILLYSSDILWLSWTGALIGALVGFVVQMWDDDSEGAVKT
jgi:hypothetical protein